MLLSQTGLDQTNQERDKEKGVEGPQEEEQLDIEPEFEEREEEEKSEEEN